MCVAGVGGRVSSLQSVSSLLDSSRVGVFLVSETMALLSLTEGVSPLSRKYRILLENSRICVLLLSKVVFPLSRVYGILLESSRVCVLLVSEGVFHLSRVSPFSLIAQGWVCC